MSMIPHHATPPAGKGTDPLEKGPLKPFSNALMNLDQDRRNAYWLMKACVVIIGVAVVSVVAIATTYNYKTYVVRVDNATGQVDTGGQLKSTNYVPQQAEIKHFLGQFILDTRTVPLDPVLFKNNVDRSLHFMTRESSNKMTAMMKSDDPRTKLGKMTIQPTIKSIQLQPGSKSTYQVRWSEESYSLGGSMSNKKVNYVGLFTVGVDPPSKEDELLINPLGLKIEDLTISVESTSSAEPSSDSSSTPAQVTAPMTTTTSDSEPAPTSRGGKVE